MIQNSSNMKPDLGQNRAYNQAKTNHFSSRHFIKYPVGILILSEISSLGNWDNM